jgi:hypothetical protein
MQMQLLVLPVLLENMLPKVSCYLITGKTLQVAKQLFMMPMYGFVD